MLTAAGSYDPDAVLASYSSFLQRVRASPGLQVRRMVVLMFVPPLSSIFLVELFSCLFLQLEPELMVDLVWHTHMQSPVRYQFDCMCLAGQFIDHNDDLDRSILLHVQSTE